MSGDGMVEVAIFDDLADGAIKLVRAGDARIALARKGDELFAVAAQCTHARIFLAPGRLGTDGLIECPMHGAKFSPSDGSVRCPPATQPLAVHRTEVIGGRIFVDPKGETIAAPAADARPASAWDKWQS